MHDDAHRICNKPHLHKKLQQKSLISRSFMNEPVLYDDRLISPEKALNLLSVLFCIVGSNDHLKLFFKSTGVMYGDAGIDYILTLVKVPSSSGCVFK